MRMKGMAPGLAVALAVSGAAAWANETVNVGICVSWPGYAMLDTGSARFGLVATSAAAARGVRRCMETGRWNSG